LGVLHLLPFFDSNIILSTALVYLVLSFYIHRVAAKEEEDQSIKDIIFSMGTREKGKNELLPLSELRTTMVNKPFCHLLFVERVETILCSWTKDTMKERPLLNVVYGLEEQQQVTVTSPAAAGKKAVGRLTRARATLLAQGDDPLEESVDLANQAMGTQPPVASTSKSTSKKQKRAKASFYDKHEAATRLSFGDSQEPDDIVDSSDDEEEEEGAAHLSTLPSPVKSASGKRKRKTSSSTPVKKSQQKKYGGRRSWTDEEKRAIKEGIREVGAGKWAEIKKMYIVILKERTSGQIKVRTRLLTSLCVAIAIVDSLTCRGHAHPYTPISWQIQKLTYCIHCLLSLFYRIAFEP
jgi:hypothetical protein